MLDRTLESLEGLDPELHEAYAPVEGGFVLRPEYAAADEANEAELVALGEQFEAELAIRHEQLVKKHTELRNLLIGRALEQTLLAADVRPGLIRGCAALLKQTLQFEFDDDYLTAEAVPWVTSPAGRQRVDLAIASWLASPAGKAFAPPERVIAFPNLRPGAAMH